MTRTLFVCPNLELGGAERHWSLLLRGLSARGEEVALLTLDGEGPFFEELRDAGVPIRCARLRSALDPLGAIRALSSVRWRPEVVVSRAVSATLVAHAISRLAGAAHVNNEHRQLARRMSGRREALLRGVAPHLDRVIAISQGQQRDLERRGFRPERVVVIPNAVDETTFVPRRGRDIVRAELALASDDIVVIAVAALRPEKRVDRFIEAIATARLDQPRLRGVVVGDGGERSRLETLAGSAGGVRFVGARADVADLLDAADVFCLTSEAEGVPMAILEAMALGLPVVATDVGGVREAVVHRQTGLLGAPDRPEMIVDALLELARAPDAAIRMGETGRARQRQRFSAAAMVAAYAAVLDEAAAGRRGALRTAKRASARARER